MQFVTAVTVHAIHASLAEMDIAGETFILAEVFISNAASVTGRAGSSHGRRLGKHVTLEQTSAHTGRLRHVTITAGGMAF